MKKLIPILLASSMTAACTGNQLIDTGLVIAGTGVVLGAVASAQPSNCLHHRTHKHYTKTDHHGHHTHYSRPHTQFFCGDDREEKLKAARIRDAHRPHHGHSHTTVTVHNH